MFSSLRHYQTLQNLYLSTGMYGLKIPKVKNTVALTPAIAISVRGFHHLMGGGGELFLFPVFSCFICFLRVSVHSYYKKANRKKDH